MKSGFITHVAAILAIVGAINWGLAAFNFNLVTALLGSWPMIVNIVYGLVGISGVILAYNWIVKHN